jgi:hypothetical protein
MRAAFTFACLLVGTASLAAHHSFSAEYDGALPVTVSGTVAKIDWQNPHVYLYLDAKDDQGNVAQWKFEGYPPNVLVRQGWKPGTTITVGDTVTVTGWRARLDPHQAAADEVTFADGKKLKAGSQAEFTKQ